MIGRKGDKPEKQQKPVREPKAAKEPKPKADKNAGTGMALAPRRGGGVPVGHAPRATLMPPEVGVRKQVATVRRRAIIAVLLAVVIAVVGTGAAFVFAASRTLQLAEAQARTQTILQKQQEFVEVRSADAQAQVLRDAQRFGTSTEILWMPDVVDKLTALAPEGVTLGAYAIEGSTPMSAFAPATVPMHDERIAVANLTVIGGELSAVEAWVERMPEIRGVVDAYLSDSEWREDALAYESHIAVYVDQRALSYRYDPDGATERDAGSEQGAVDDESASDEEPVDAPIENEEQN